jgi:quercetin dioxygenase-like cupin family protein
MKEKLMTTRRNTVIVLSLLTALATGHGARAEHEHIFQNKQDVHWENAPPFLPPGAKAAILRGNPHEKELFAVRLMLPANYKIPAHSHPADEHVMVVSGALYMGMGDKLDTGTGKALNAGGFALVPAKKHHFAYTKEPTMIVVFGIGPVEFNYVNPADDPRNTK